MPHSELTRSPVVPSAGRSIFSVHPSVPRTQLTEWYLDTPIKLQEFAPFEIGKGTNHRTVRKLHQSPKTGARDKSSTCSGNEFKQKSNTKLTSFPPSGSRASRLQGNQGRSTNLLLDAKPVSAASTSKVRKVITQHQSYNDKHANHGHNRLPSRHGYSREKETKTDVKGRCDNLSLHLFDPSSFDAPSKPHEWEEMLSGIATARPMLHRQSLDVLNDQGHIPYSQEYQETDPVGESTYPSLTTARMQGPYDALGTVHSYQNSVQPDPSYHFSGTSAAAGRPFMQSAPYEGQTTMTRTNTMFENFLAEHSPDQSLWASPFAESDAEERLSSRITDEYSLEQTQFSTEDTDGESFPFAHFTEALQGIIPPASYGADHEIFAGWTFEDLGVAL